MTLQTKIYLHHFITNSKVPPLVPPHPPIFFSFSNLIAKLKGLTAHAAWYINYQSHALVWIQVEKLGEDVVANRRTDVT